MKFRTERANVRVMKKPGQCSGRTGAVRRTRRRAAISRGYLGSRSGSDGGQLGDLLREPVGVALEHEQVDVGEGRLDPRLVEALAVSSGTVTHETGKAVWFELAWDAEMAG